MSISLLISIYHLRCLPLLSLLKDNGIFIFNSTPSPFFFFLFLFSFTRSWWVVGRAQIQAFSGEKLVHACRIPWSVLEGKWWAVGTSTRADASAFTSDPQLFSHRRRYQTGQNIPSNSHTCYDSLVRVSQQQRWNYQTTKSPLFGLLLSGSQELVVTTWAREVRGVVFHTTRRTQRWTREYDREPWRQKAHYRIPKAVWRWTGVGCGRGWLQWSHTATENRKDCDHGGHRPATPTPTPTTSSDNSWVISVQVENLSAMCSHTARKPPGELNILQLLQKTTRVLSRKTTHQCIFEFHSSWHS